MSKKNSSNEVGDVINLETIYKNRKRVSEEVKKWPKWKKDALNDTAIKLEKKSSTNTNKNT